MKNIDEKVKIFEEAAKNAYQEPFDDIKVPEDWAANLMDQIVNIDTSAANLDFALENKIFNISWIVTLAATIIFFLSVFIVFEETQTEDTSTFDNEIQALYTGDSYNSIISEMMQ